MTKQIAASNVSATSRLAAARAEFNERKDAIKAKVSAKFQAPEAEARTEPVVEPLSEATASALGQILADLKVPSFARVICGTLFGIVMAAGFGYLFGYVMLALMIGAAALSGSMFIVNVIYVIGLIYVAIKGATIGIRGAAYVISGGVDQTYGKVTGWFKRDKKVREPAVFTGAFEHGAA